ncbi:hypothetical protein XENTR_v10004994 [Xenopus tropicalis]|nr:hypothetical protein XENTR_v10004994 [Xenopus tropicalis]
MAQINPPPSAAAVGIPGRELASDCESAQPGGIMSQQPAGGCTKPYGPSFPIHPPPPYYVILGIPPYDIIQYVTASFPPFFLRAAGWFVLILPGSLSQRTAPCSEVSHDAFLLPNKRSSL